MGVGGSIVEVTFDGRIFSVAADADSNRDLGGFTNEYQSNGDGSARIIKTRKPWMVDGLTLDIDDDRGDQEFLQERASEPQNYPISVTYVSGITYTGQGNLVEDVIASSANATLAAKFSGPGILKKQ